MTNSGGYDAHGDSEQPEKKLRVAVLMGGASSERQVSLATGAQIVDGLDKSKYEVSAIDTVDLLSFAGPRAVAGTPYIAASAVESTENLMHYPIEISNSSEMLGFRGRADLALIALHGKGGEDGSIQGLLEFLGVPYTGSGILASALAMNKSMSKRLFKAEGIPVIDDVILSRSTWTNCTKSDTVCQILDKLGTDVFVKPNSEGSTFGCTRARTTAHIEEAINAAFGYDNDILIERYVQGTEITVGVLETVGGKPECLPIVEIVPSGEFYDYDSKYKDGGSEHIIPARIGQAATAAAQSYAMRCHALLGCTGMSRTDIIVSGDDLFVLEVNTIPGMTPTSLLPQAAAHAGISFTALLDRIIDSAMNRMHRARQY